MSWISLIVFLIQYGPAMYKLIKDIIAMIRELRNRGVKTGAFEGGLHDALSRYKETGDETELRDMYAKLDQHLRGVA